MEDFFDFFAKSHDHWPPPDKSDVENRQGHDGRERGGLTEQIMQQGEALPRVPGILRALFHTCGNNSMAVTVLSPNLLDTQRRTS
jgi:hypothetical protein